MKFIFTFKRFINRIIKGARKSPLLFKKMAIKVQGNVVTKDGIQQGKKPELKDYKLTNKEIDFILSKLRESNYKGFEFEIFYAVWVKLNEHKTKE